MRKYFPKVLYPPGIQFFVCSLSFIQIHLLNGRGFIVDRSKKACIMWHMLDIFDTKDKYSMLYLIWWIYIYTCAHITGKKEEDSERRKSLNRWVAEQGMGIECV